MTNQGYCGRCHTFTQEVWLDGQATMKCNCPLIGGPGPDFSKDPNCHNANHDHHDPRSPIVLSRQAEYEAEERAEAEAKARWAPEPYLQERADD